VRVKDFEPLKTKNSTIWLSVVLAILYQAPQSCDTSCKIFTVLLPSNIFVRSFWIVTPVKRFVLTCKGIIAF
jgi:hypothetical protein